MEDISWKEREQRIAELRRSRSQFEDKEFIELIDEENKKLQNEINNLKNQVSEFEDANLTLTIDIEEKTAKYNFDISQLNQVIISQQENQSQSIQGNNIVDNFAQLPENLSAVLKLIETIYEGRIVVLPEAHDSSSDAEFEDIHSAWSLLWSMGTVLWDLYFEENTDTAQIISKFKCASGFDITLTEGKQTKRDKRMMKQRERIYKGVSVDFTPHAKIDKANKNLRVHYFVDQTKKLIVIGHCGDHLDTYGTRRRKE